MKIGRLEINFKVHEKPLTSKEAYYKVTEDNIHKMIRLENSIQKLSKSFDLNMGRINQLEQAVSNTTLILDKITKEIMRTKSK